MELGDYVNVVMERIAIRVMTPFRQYFIVGTYIHRARKKVTIYTLDFNIIPHKSAQRGALNVCV